MVVCTDAGEQVSGAVGETQTHTRWSITQREPHTLLCSGVSPSRKRKEK